MRKKKTEQDYAKKIKWLADKHELEMDRLIDAQNKDRMKRVNFNPDLTPDSSYFGKMCNRMIDGIDRLLNLMSDRDADRNLKFNPETGKMENIDSFHH